MNEAETRAEYIDPALAAAGWGVVEGSRTADWGARQGMGAGAAHWIYAGPFRSYALV